MHDPGGGRRARPQPPDPLAQPTLVQDGGFANLTWQNLVMCAVAGVLVRPETLYIMLLGAVAFSFSTAGGIVLAKILNIVLPEGRRIDPSIGAAGVSEVPMSARVVQGFVARHSQGRVNPLMAAMGPNVAGVIGSAVTAGVFLALLR